MYKYYLGSRPTNSNLTQYQGEIRFFDFYVLPLAKKLKECGVFGVSGDEYLNYAKTNRDAWEVQGEALVKEFLSDYKQFRLEEEEQRTKMELGVDSLGSIEHDLDKSEIDNPLILPEETIHRVVESWELLRRVPDYDGVAGRQLFSA